MATVTYVHTSDRKLLQAWYDKSELITSLLVSDELRTKRQLFCQALAAKHANLTFELLEYLWPRWNNEKRYIVAQVIQDTGIPKLQTKIDSLVGYDLTGFRQNPTELALMLQQLLSSKRDQQVRSNQQRKRGTNTVGVR